jgi:anti-repressor protein
MNDLIQNVRTMDSREIAELTGKEHRNVMADIRDQLGKLPGGVLRFQHTYHVDENNQDYPCFYLPYRETMILVSGYRVDLRAKIIDRWLELELASAPSIPKSFAEALQLAADQAKEIEAKTQALALAAPKVACAEALMRCDQNMSITDACKHFGLHPKTEAFPYLRAMKYLTLKDLPTQAAIDAGYLELKETLLPDGTMRQQAVVAVWQLENWRAHVVHQVKRWAGEIK